VSALLVASRVVLSSVEGDTVILIVSSNCRSMLTPFLLPKHGISAVGPPEQNRTEQRLYFILSFRM
jgi:hypothetical protein